MARNLFEVVQALFIPCVLFAMVAAATIRSGSKKTAVWFWRASAVLAVIVLAVSFLRERRLVRYNQINNIYLLALSIVFGFLCAAFFFALASGKVRGKRIPAVSATLALVFSACLFLYAVPPVYELPFHFVVMDDTYFSTAFLAKCSGYLFGLLACALAALASYKVFSRMGPRKSTAAFFLLHLVNAFISFVSLIGIINSYYRRKFRLPAGLRRSIPHLITAENVAFFVAFIILAVAAVSFFVYNVRIHGEYNNPAEHRKLRAEARSGRRQAAFLLALLAFAWIDMTLVKKAASTLAELSPSENYQIDGNEIFIPLEQVGDGHLHRFTWTNGNGKEIRFIIVQKRGMNFGVGFDACEVCGNVGYYERKDEVVCNRCDVVMNRNTIGLKGGCNPIPLHSRIEGGGILILTDDLDKEAKRF